MATGCYGHKCKSMMRTEPATPWSSPELNLTGCLVSPVFAHSPQTGCPTGPLLCPARPGHLQRLLVDSLPRQFPSRQPVGVHNRNAVPPEPRGDGRPFTGAEIPEIQIAHYSGGVDDRHRDTCLLCSRV